MTYFILFGGLKVKNIRSRFMDLSEPHKHTWMHLGNLFCLLWALCRTALNSITPTQCHWETTIRLTESLCNEKTNRSIYFSITIGKNILQHFIIAMATKKRVIIWNDMGSKHDVTRKEATEQFEKEKAKKMWWRKVHWTWEWAATISYLSPEPLPLISRLIDSSWTNLWKMAITSFKSLNCRIQMP